MVKYLIEYTGLWQALGGAILTSAVILFGIKQMFRKEQKHEKYMLLKKREVNTFAGKEIWEVTDNEIIKAQSDEIEILKQERQKLEEKILALKKEYQDLSFQAILAVMIMLLGVIFYTIFHRKKTID